MIKVVLVDNDVLDLMQLKQLLKVPLDCVVKDFIYPREALEYMEREGADILITDMKMPHMDGISLIKNAKKLLPLLHTIVISSYKDFEYVKESFKEGSLDYILKHTLSEQVLKEAFDQAVSKMEEHRLKEKDPEVLNRSRQLLKVKMIQQVILGEITPETFERQMKKYGIEIPSSLFVLMVCEIDDYQNITVSFNRADTRIFWDSVMETVEKSLEGFRNAEAIAGRDGELLLLLPMGEIRSEARMQSETEAVIERVKRMLFRMFNMNLSIGVSNPVPVRMLPLQYESCRKYLNRKFLEGKGGVYRTESTAKISTGVKMVSGSERPYRELLQKIKEGNTDREILDRLFTYYKSNYYPREMGELQMVEVLQCLWAVAGEKNLELEEDYQLPVFYDRFCRLETIEDMQQQINIFFTCFEKAKQEREEKEHTGFNRYTIACLDYIRKNYANPLSLQEVADYMGVNHTYLSKLFKEDTGENFVGYLTDYRVGKAKELIERRQYKIKDIYALVGFSSYNYFFKVFKKAVGCSPLEYENKKSIVNPKKV